MGPASRWPIRAAAARAVAVALLVGAGGTWCPVLAGDGDALVIVNGTPISKKRVVDVVMDAYGLQVMQQMIVLELVKDEARRRGIKVTRGDVEKERQAALDRIAKDSGLSGPEATESNKLKALQTVLDQRHISMAEFMIGMERNAYLRKMVEQNFKVDEKTLREEFARTYGERVQVRHIQVAVRNPGRLNEVVTLLQRGADFAEVARDKSTNVETAPRGGELPPFTFDDDRIDPLLREAAFSLKVGEVSSPIRVGQYYHILKLERRIPPENVRFENVRSQVEAALRERVIPEKMGELATELFNKASIKVIDPAMRMRYKKFLEDNTPAK